MEKFIKLLRYGAILFGGSAVIYLANEGELGVNLTTIMSTASPVVVIVITYIFEALRYILPTVMVKMMTGKIIGVLGQDNADYIKQIINNKSPQEVVGVLGEMYDEFKEMKETLTLIRQDQKAVVPK